MPELKRNHRQVDAAQALNGKRTRYTIEGVKGLGLEVWPTGGRNWIFKYQIGAGRKGRKERYVSIGNAKMISLASAIKQAEDLYHQVKQQGRDPAKEKPVVDETVLTVTQLIDQFLTKHVKPKLRPVSAKQYEYRLKAFVEPELGELRADHVKKRDIIELADGIAEDGKAEKKSSGRGGKGGDREGGAPRLADGVVEIVSSLYGWAQKRDMLEHNPAFKIGKYSERPRRNRVLADHEFKKFWNGVEIPEVGEKIRTILRLCLLTGQRRGEVAGALVSEFDLKSNQPRWTIGADRTKNGTAHTVPLSSMALDHWRRAIEDYSDDEFVFPTDRVGMSQHIHYSAVTKAMRIVRGVSDLPEVTVHDLRRTVRTRMAALKIPREVSARVLNHADEYERGVHDESYNRHEYFDEKLEALGKWETLVASLIEGSDSPLAI